ncbi:DUF4268 domain-containing protein [Thomasclavelia spiroformis]|uniref:DUF4268 domain-containing protein n=1 Tax=Thomasclavelia spiroformis TaxID=29348 RepID=UPI002430DCF0|nr:DUF4268 domain-containing protein [Thomasclavelia spiroformis]
MKIGSLIEIDIRELWIHEQYDFSNWLSKEDNIKLLGDEVGFTLTNVNKEVYIGSYRCDLVATDETSGDKIIIENQLEATNHDHLGKIITYAAGLDAKSIIWIVQQAREEHRAAIEWLNNNTSKEIGFFLLEIHAYKIDNSRPAPMFKIIEKPNDFVKNSKNGYKEGEMTRSQSERLIFWTEMNKVLVERGKPFNVRKASTDHWYDVALGTSQAHITISLISKNNFITIEVCINNNKELYDKLYALKDEIEEKLDIKLEWLRLDNKKACRILTYINGLDFDDHSNYPELVNKSIDTVIKFRNVFAPYFK